MSQLFRTDWAGKGRAGLHKSTREKDGMYVRNRNGRSRGSEGGGHLEERTDVRLKVCRLVHNSHNIKRLQKKQRKL